jgi:hypothetical protein
VFLLLLLGKFAKSLDKQLDAENMFTRNLYFKRYETVRRRDEEEEEEEEQQQQQQQKVFNSRYSNFPFNFKESFAIYL